MRYCGGTISAGMTVTQRVNTVNPRHTYSTNKPIKRQHTQLVCLQALCDAMMVKVKVENTAFAESVISSHSVELKSPSIHLAKSSPQSNKNPSVTATASISQVQSIRRPLFCLAEHLHFSIEMCMTTTVILNADTINCEARIRFSANIFRSSCPKSFISLVGSGALVC
mgnify:CR=1 FL=1